MIELTSKSLSDIGDENLLAILKAGPEMFFKTLEEEILYRMLGGKARAALARLLVANNKPDIPARVEPIKTEPTKPIKTKRVVSDKTRKKMSRSQKKRWADGLGDSLSIR